MGASEVCRRRMRSTRGRGLGSTPVEGLALTTALAWSAIALGALCWSGVEAAPFTPRSSPLEDQQPVTEIGALMYLQKYGYVPPSNSGSGALYSENDLRSAVREFQAFAGLNLTGELDNETVTLMQTPRCGVKDIVGQGGGRSKRYALQGSRWRTKNLTYRISKYPSQLNRDAVDEEIRRAFAVWSEQTDLTFTAKPSGSNVHIEIRFERGEHGDGDPFDGRGGTLAHAYFPVYGGDAHFDDDEHWTINQYRGTNLFQVAAHEFGHSLGLSHSDVKAALMAPFYRGYEPAFTLHPDDVDGIQALYGKKSRAGGGELTSTSTSRPPARPPTAAADRALCADARVDAMFNSAEGVTYAFKGDLYYKLNDAGVEPGYPKRISDAWPGLPGNIDAAFTYRNGKTYFFKGKQYWRFVGKRMDGDYPKAISEGFTGIPDNIDASMVWSGNGKIYFFKGTKFWKFDPTQKPPVKSTYPKPISNWEGVPDNLDASVVYKGYTYFFKGTKYYRFDDRSFAVDTGSPAFPRPTAKWWFGCKESQYIGNSQAAGAPWSAPGEDAWSAGPGSGPGLGLGAGSTLDGEAGLRAAAAAAPRDGAVGDAELDADSNNKDVPRDISSMALTLGASPAVTMAALVATSLTAFVRRLLGV